MIPFHVRLMVEGERETTCPPIGKAWGVVLASTWEEAALTWARENLQESDLPAWVAVAPGSLVLWHPTGVPKMMRSFLIRGAQ